MGSTDRGGENGRGRVWKKENHEKQREARHVSMIGSLFEWKVR